MTAAHVDAGTLHYGGALHTAWHTGLPVLITAGSPPTAYAGTLPGARDEGGHLWMQETYDQHAIVRNYVGDELEWDVNLVLKSREVPALKLGGAERLGWTTWLHPRTSQRNAADLHLRPKRYFAPGGRATPAGSAQRAPSSVVGAGVGALAQ